MNNTENVESIDELNSRISMHIADGYKVIYRDNHVASLTKHSINWVFLIILLILFWPGAIMYIFLYITGHVGKKKSLSLKVAN